MAKGGSESKRLKRKREDNLWEEKLPKGWFWVWWPDSGWWKVRITEIEEEEEWYWPGTQEPLDTPILPLTIAYDSDKNGSTCFIERVLWHEGVLYDQEGEETISYCLSPPKDYVADNREQSPSNVSSPSSSSSSAGSSETGARLREKVFSERNKETKLHVNPKTKKVGTSPRKDTELQQRVAENMREKAKNILKQTLLENVEEANVEVDEAHIENIAVDIEKALYEKYAKADYLAQLRSITFNLRGKRNLELKRAIVVSEISPTRLAEMTADELASKSMREERKRREQESFARAVIRDPTDVGIVKGMNSTEVSHKGREDSYESEKAVTKDALLQAREEEVGEEEETGVSTLEAPSPVSGAAVSDAQVTPKEPPTRETYEQNDSVEAQQSSNLTLGNVEFPFSSGLDDKFQQFATSVGEPEADRPSRSVLRGSTTNAVRSKRRTAVWQGNISFDETKSFHAMAFYLIGANNYTVLPQQLNVIGRTELGSTIEFVKGLEQSTSREFSILYFKPVSICFSCLL